MPRLGDQNESASGRPPMAAAAAYPNTRRNSVLNIAAILAFVLVLRNVFFNDYRTAEIGYLRSTGKSDEEIERFIPKTGRERMMSQQQRMNQQAKLMADVAVLKEQVHELRVQVLGEEKASTKGSVSQSASISTSSSAKKVASVSEKAEAVSPKLDKGDGEVEASEKKE